MNRVVTSKDQLLKMSKEIVFEEGLSKLNIRYLAQKCGISVGSVYNYFPSKSELILAVVQEFWKSLFHEDLCKLEKNISFPEFFETVYYRLSDQLTEFRLIFLSQLSGMEGSDVAKAKEIEEVYLSHVHEGFLKVLKYDKYISPNLWTEKFTPEKFISFVFSNILMMLKNGEKDCSYLKEVICRLLRY